VTALQISALLMLPSRCSFFFLLRCTFSLVFHLVVHFSPSFSIFFSNRGAGTCACGRIAVAAGGRGSTAAAC